MESAVPSLAEAIHLCFVLGDADNAENAALHRRDVLNIAEISGMVQPILLRLQKQLVQGRAADDARLLVAVGSVRSALEQLQAAGSRCRARHWLLRVLMARDVRLQLQTAFNSTAAGLGQFSEAAAAVVQDASLAAQLIDSLDQVQQRLAAHSLTRHSTLEGLARGLFKHMEGLTDASELPDMLRFAIQEAAATSIKPSSNGGSSSSSRWSEVLPPGETSLRDPGLLAGLEEVADCKLENPQQQLALHQIISVLEELHEERRRRHQKQRKRDKHRQQEQQQQGGSAAGLRRVSEANDEDLDADYAAAVAARGDESSNDDDTLPGSSRDQAAVAAAATWARPHQQHQRPAAQSAPGASVINLDDDDEDEEQQQQQPRYSEAVEAMMGQLEQMLWQNPWDAAALTQLLELLLQVEAAGEQQQQQQQQADGRRCSSSGNSQQQQEQAEVAAAGGQQAGGRKWWKIGGAARAAQTKTAPGRPQSGVVPVSAIGQGAGESDRCSSDEQQQHLMKDRLHQLALAALDALLRLTPRPADAESFCKPLSRDGVCTEAGHSLALPLMKHEDTVPALAAALFGRHDVAARAAQLLATLIRSGPAVMAAEGGSGFGRTDNGAEASYTRFCKAVCATGGSAGGGSNRPAGSSSYGSSGGYESRASIAADPNTVLGAYMADLAGGGSGAARHSPSAPGSNGTAGSSSSSSTSSAWYGLTHLLHSQHYAAAGAAAEALAAVGGSRAMTDICSSLTATQQARALLLLLSKHKLHPGAAGAAAAALQSLADPALRPAMYRILANSYFDAVPGASGALGELLVALMGAKDDLAARRAAGLAAALAPAVTWDGAASLWRRTFASAQQLLLAGTASGGNGSSSRNRTAAALLLRQLLGDRDVLPSAGGVGVDDDAVAALLLVQQQEGGGGFGLVSPLMAAGLDEGEKNELLFEALQLSVQQFGLTGNWEGLHDHHHHHHHHQKGRGSSGSRGASEAAPLYDEGWAAAELMGALLQWLPAEACCVPELSSVVLPALEHLAATRQGSRQLQHAVRCVHEQLLVLG